ncbi:hypothetical protein PFISCL1PPCAC_2166, partial [Pristionchus fissidentatus]
VYAHEMMHQYFGNLVTLSWWDEVWLNEGLTTMYEIYAEYGIGTGAVDDLLTRRRQHMRHFLNKFAYKAVTGEDFLSTIGEIARNHYQDNTPELAYKMAKDFLELPGFPLVKINRKGRKFELSQVRFVRGLSISPFRISKHLCRNFWTLPIHLTKIDGTPYKTVMMTERNVEIDVDTDDELILDSSKV